jgi:hypothetical protein
MPLGPERLDHRIGNRLTAALAFRAVAVRVAADAPRVAVLFDKGGRRVERVAALSAEKVAGVPLGAARDDDFALDGCLARLAAGREELVEVERAEEALRWVRAVFGFEARHVVGRRVRGEEREVDAALARADALGALCVLFVGLRIEGDAFELLAALVAREALRVEAQAGGGDGAAGDGERALRAESAVADDGGWGPVGARAGAAAERLLCVLGGIRQGPRAGCV